MGGKKNLSYRIALRVLAASAAAVVSLIGAIVFASTRSFLEIEKEMVEAGLDRVEAAIDKEIDQLESSAADYAVWDETYDFVRGVGSGYVERNMQGKYIENLGADFAAVYAEDGGLLVSHARAGLDPSRFAPASLEASSPVFAPTASGSIRKGIVLFGDRALAFAAAAARPSVGDAPGKGLFVFARLVDESFAAEVSALAGLRTALLPASEGQALARSIARQGANAPVIGQVPIPGPDGRAAVVAATTQERTVFREGLRSIVLWAVVSFLVLAAAAGLVLAALDSIIVVPMKKIEKAIAAGRSADAGFDRELEELAGRNDAVGITARVVKASLEASLRLIDAQQAATEQLESEVRARTRELTIFKRVMEGTGEGVLITGIDGTIQQANQAFREMTGYEEHELVGRNPRILKSGRHDEAFFAAMRESIRDSGRWSGEVWNSRKNGEEFPVLLSIDTIRDEAGEPIRYVGISADIGKLKEAEKSLNRLAFYDSLTDLPNRALFKDRFKQAIARAQRAGSRLALVYLDLDRFKNVNDSLGHHAGDELLRQTAERLRSQVREADTVCRLGGDEFTVILENIGSSGDAAAVARKIISAMRGAFTVEGSEVFIGTSIGIALFPYDGTDADELIKRADAAMYEAKEHGRGQLRFASGESGVSSVRRLDTETRIRKGLDKNEFYVSFQPQVSAGGASEGSSAGIIGAEALIRWKPSGKEPIGPDSFIEIAEDTGLIVPLGSFVLKESCAEAKRWLDAGSPLVVSVNVSQTQFDRGRIVEQVSEALSETGLPPAYLKLEITESLFTRDMDRMVAIMRELKSGGVSFAVDDFGTGYSSLRYIDRLPIDSLKIDKSFIQRIDSRYDGGEIATAVVALARSFGLESIAEGVETEDQLDALRSRGCDAIQGYFVSKPLSAPDFRSFIADRMTFPETISPD